jgi:hypothetical protein
MIKKIVAALPQDSSAISEFLKESQVEVRFRDTLLKKTGQSAEN